MDLFNSNTLKYRVLNFDTEIENLPPTLFNADEYLNILGEFKIIPKFQSATSNSINLLKYIQHIANQSSTHISCINFINDFAFGGALSCRLNSVPNFESDANTVSTQQKKEFLELSQSIGIDFVQVRNVTELLNKSLIESGDAFLYIKIQKVLQSYNVTFCAVPYTDFMYYENKDKTIDKGIWAKEITLKALVEKRYKIVSVTKFGSKAYNFAKEKDGSISTIIHVKNSDDTQLYGNIGIESILQAIRAQSQQANFFIKADKNELTAKHILFTPALPVSLTDEEKERELRERRKSLDEIATVKGKEPKTIIASEYFPDENGKPSLFNLDVSRDAKWQETKETWSKSIICGFHKTPPDILGIETAKAGLGSDTIVNNMIKFDATVIQPKQNYFENLWSYVFSMLAVKTEQQSLAQYTIKFKDNVLDFIGKIAQYSTKSNTSNTNNNIDNGNN